MLFKGTTANPLRNEIFYLMGVKVTSQIRDLNMKFRITISELLGESKIETKQRPW